MRRFGYVPDSHVRKSLGVFTSAKTNNLYFLMEYYKNGALDRLLEKRGTIPEDEATEKFIIPLAKALNVLHQNHCVHLDLKPENVLIDDDGLAVLADLGNSKLYDDEGNQLSFGEYASCSEYAAPEEDSRTSRKFHPEMDIYALGAIFYELLTGNSPRFFDPETMDSPDISDGAKEAIIAAMEPDPDLRTSDVMTLVHALPGHEKDEWVLGEPEYPEEEEEDIFDVYGDLSIFDDDLD
jgi:serine/threonine protein kinase